MMVQARQFKSLPQLERNIRKLGGLADKYYDLPMPSTAENWLKRGNTPESDNMVKVFMLFLKPLEKYPYKGYFLAEKVANLLEYRHQAYNDWACGIKSEQEVFLFIKPWGCSFGGKRVWFRPDNADMEVIRSLDRFYRRTRVYDFRRR